MAEPILHRKQFGPFPDQVRADRVLECVAVPQVLWYSSLLRVLYAQDMQHKAADAGAFSRGEQLGGFLALRRALCLASFFKEAFSGATCARQH